MKGYLPAPIWAGAAALALLIAGVGYYLCKKKREALPSVAMALLLEYAALVVCTTLVFRHSSESYMLKWPPMWSYMPAYGGGTLHNWIANGLNVLMFVPIGGLYKLAVKHSRWWTMLTVAAAFSLAIELMQLLLHLGYCEVDDLVHNCLGALIGYGACAMLTIWASEWKKCIGR